MVLEHIEKGFESLNKIIESVLFFDLAPWSETVKLKFAVVWLVLWAFSLTLLFGFVNLRGFKHAVDVLRGKFSSAEETGSITPMQALTAALSATVGLGNIGGVAAAIGAGGPGATFWMMFAGFLGMTSKFAECTLGQKYKVTREDGTAYGGPHIYLRTGLTERGYGGVGCFLASAFSVMCTCASFGGGNMFQINQAFEQLKIVFPSFDNYWVGVVFGLVVAFAVGVVIIGGVKRIADVASNVVPIMCGVYVVFAILFLIIKISDVPGAFGKIFTEAFSPTAVKGGVIGVVVIGFQRAAFSNEAGCGSASIMHSAAKADVPLREGFVALLEPFIDTIIVCTITALVIVVSGAYTLDKDVTGEEIQLTSYAFETVFPWFRYVLAPIALLFAFSTMISWSYYGEQTFTSLFGEQSGIYYKILFCICAFLGCNLKAGAVLVFSDLMILGICIPNLTGVGFLASGIKSDLASYWAHLRNGTSPVKAARQEKTNEMSLFS